MRVLRQALRSFRGDESGQSLIVIVSAMTVLLGIAAFAIDTANWMVRHHDAQVVADSAALAAAQCLANPHQPANIEVNGAQQTLTCSSSTDTPDAQYVAVAYAAANGVTIQPSDVTFSGKVVTVSASTTTPSIFARVMGIGTTSQSARAGAGWTAGSACTTAGQNCDFMFANSSSCSSSSAALNVSTQGKATIEGNIQTNGYLSADGTGNAGGIDGTGNFGSNCPNGSAVTGNHDPWKTGDPTQASAPMTWPIDYTKDFPACGTAGDPCQLNGYPSFCKNEGTNIIVGTTAGLPPSDKPSPGLIYCASGTSTNLGDPSTWNGSVTISMSGSNTINDSFVGGTISYSGDGGDTISACGWTASGYSSSSCSSPAPATPNYPLFYAVGKDPNSAACAAGTNPATSCAFSMQSGGNLTLDGDMFVENGTGSFNFTGDQTAANTFIEANTIVASLDGDVKGDGPPVDNGNGTGGPGTISLVQ